MALRIKSGPGKFELAVGYFDHQRVYFIVSDGQRTSSEYFKVLTLDRDPNKSNERKIKLWKDRPSSEYGAIFQLEKTKGKDYWCFVAHQKDDKWTTMEPVDNPT
jgi:hypothetical protein